MKVIALLLFAVGCSKTTNQGQHSPDSVPNEVAQKISTTAGMPDAYDSKTLEYIATREVEQKFCSYTVTESVIVTQASQARVETSITRKFVKDSENSATCPDRPSDLREYVTTSESPEDYAQAELRFYRESLDVERFTRNLSWKSATIISSQEKYIENLRAQVVEMELVSKTNKKYILTQAFSLDSFFLGRFHYNLIKAGGSAPTKYESLKTYSVGKVGKK